VEGGERVVVGVNRFQEGGGEAGPELLRIDPEFEVRQVDRLRELRSRRDAAAWRASLDAMADTARSGANLLPPMIDAVMAWATVGEIAGRLREVFGEHRETLVV
jgi:methylmalonyl-CoA mutase N-terminal domain/subunit